MHTLPVVHVQQRQPQLAPARQARRAAQAPQRRARLHHHRVVRRHADDAQHDVVERRAKHGRVSFDVDAPAAIVRVPSVPQVPSNFHAPRSWDRRLRHVHADDQARKQEHRATILAGKVPVVCLQVAIERQSTLRRFQRCRGRLRIRLGAHRQPEPVPVHRRLRPCLYLRVRLQIVPDVPPHIRDTQSPSMQVGLSEWRSCHVGHEKATLHTAPGPLVAAFLPPPPCHGM